MALSEALRETRNSSTGIPCSVAALLAGLGDADRVALTDALAGSMSARLIFQALVREGHTVGRQTIQRHRRGDCRCT